MRYYLITVQEMVLVLNRSRKSMDFIDTYLKCRGNSAVTLGGTENLAEDEETAATAVMRELISEFVQQFKAGKSNKALLDEYHSRDTTVYDILELDFGFRPVREILSELHPDSLDNVKPYRFGEEKDYGRDQTTSY